MEIGGSTGDGAAAEEGHASDDVFGTRPSADRPHSMNLCAARGGPSAGSAGRAADILLGVGLGAAVMYYLDPVAGADRRARLSNVLGAAIGFLGETMRARRGFESNGDGRRPVSQVTSKPVGGELRHSL
jgi:hypothetical protein